MQPKKGNQVSKGWFNYVDTQKTGDHTKNPSAGRKGNSLKINQREICFLRQISQPSWQSSISWQTTIYHWPRMKTVNWDKEQNLGLLLRYITLILWHLTIYNCPNKQCTNKKSPTIQCIQNMPYSSFSKKKQKCYVHVFWVALHRCFMFMSRFYT